MQLAGCAAPCLRLHKPHYAQGQSCYRVHTASALAILPRRIDSLHGFGTRVRYPHLHPLHLRLLTSPLSHMGHLSHRHCHCPCPDPLCTDLTEPCPSCLPRLCSSTHMSNATHHFFHGREKVVCLGSCTGTIPVMHRCPDCAMHVCVCVCACVCVCVCVWVELPESLSSSLLASLVSPSCSLDRRLHGHIMHAGTRPHMHGHALRPRTYGAVRVYAGLLADVLLSDSHIQTATPVRECAHCVCVCVCIHLPCDPEQPVLMVSSKLSVCIDSRCTRH